MLPSKEKLKLLCDENIPHKIFEFLKNSFNAKKVLAGSSDAEVASVAKEEGRIIITFDKDFGNILLFPPEKYFGIIVIRVRPPTVKVVLSSLEKLLNSISSSESKGKLYVTSVSGFRVFPKK